MRLVVPGGDGGALDELRRGYADAGAHVLHHRDYFRVAGDEARAVSGHVAALGERVDDDGAAVAGRGGCLEQPRRRAVILLPYCLAVLVIQFAVRLVRGDVEAVPLGQGEHVAVVAERRHGAGGVVGVVEPEQFEALADGGRNGVEIG